MCWGLPFSLLQCFSNIEYICFFVHGTLRMVQDNDEHKNLVLDQFMTEVLQYCFSKSAINVMWPILYHHLFDTGIAHLYLDYAGVGFIFSMDYGGHDHMTLGGLLQPNSTDLSKMVENFATIIQSSSHIVLTNKTVFCIWPVSLFLWAVGRPRLWTRSTCSIVQGLSNTVLWMFSGKCRVPFCWLWIAIMLTRNILKLLTPNFLIIKLGF